MTTTTTTPTAAERILRGHTALLAAAEKRAADTAAPTDLRGAALAEAHRHLDAARRALHRWNSEGAPGEVTFRAGAWLGATSRRLSPIAHQMRLEAEAAAFAAVA